MSGTRTDRLLLRPVTRDDLVAAEEVLGDPRTSEHLPGGPASPAEAQAKLDFWVAHWRTRGFGYWAVELAGSTGVLGFGGLQLGDVPGERYLNLFYRLRPSAWGHGYAAEVGRAAQAEATARGLPVWIVTGAANEASRRVAERLGFTEFRQGPHQGGWSRFYRWPPGNPVAPPPAPH
ncbi:GNAT family N-acetyltransferase [Actinokineospora bangkokensis]|uniref:N-acetyltransferase domain-containing protein n=1 Tax=Actinokineospora bangkokensis TaxID=1193682 RepID=A0A1Q9LHK0_9PSEU|nr:GNAT family N-acetyltransferase [Actinokineospora bangkokensis]OLR91495.1 hypothetical protein BJP25_26405 [Actinokineospora bangkokensis]